MIIVGLIEIIAGLLMIFPKTRFAGVLMILPVITRKLRPSDEAQAMAQLLGCPHKGHRQGSMAGDNDMVRKL